MRRANERGSALLVALGVLVLLSLMGVTFAMLTRMEMQAAINFDAVLRAQLLAEAGLQRALTELQDLYVGPLFRPRYDGGPPALPGSLTFEVSRPYSSTVAAAQCQTWGAGRGIELSAAVDTYTLLQGVELPDPVSSESAPYLWSEPSLWSGPGHGQLGDGYFDARFGMEPTVVNAVTAPRESFRVVRGVVDLSGLVNVNRANEQLLAGLLVYFGFTGVDANTAASAIVTSRTDDGRFRYVHELVDRGLLTMPQLYGEDANANGLLDSGEDANGNGVLDGALKDCITVFPILGAINALSSRININTAPEPVLFAVFHGIPSLNAAEALNLARAVILYRSGGPAPTGDSVEGVVSEAEVGADHTGDADQDDLYSDDNPFDGVAPFYSTPAAEWLPEFADDDLDNDGDTVAEELVAAGSVAFDRYLFPNGPGGFSEFEYFLDYVVTQPPFALPFTAQQIAEIKANASTRVDIDFDGDGVAGTDGNPPEDWERSSWTAPFRYDSSQWLIISQGVVERAGRMRAQATLSAVVSYRQ